MPTNKPKKNNTYVRGSNVPPPRKTPAMPPVKKPAPKKSN